MAHAIRLAGLFLLAVAGPVAAQAPAAKAPVSPEDQKILKDVGMPVDSKSLLAYLRKQTYPEADPKQMDNLIRELGDDDFKTRESAYGRLIGLGKGAIVGLKQAEKDKDPEIRRRARDLRQRLESKVEPAIQSATARLLARLQPDETADVLLGFLPFAADTTVADEVSKALEAVTADAAAPAPAVVKGLQDKHPLKRGAAAAALSRSKAHVPAVREMLKDPDPLVRVRVGLALVRNKDQVATGEALPALIEAIQHLPPENLWAVEDVLIRLAGDGNVPPVSLGQNEQARQAAYKGWNDWYVKHRDKIQLARLEGTDAHLGRTLLVYQNFNRFVAGAGRRPAMGEVMEVDKSKNVLWKLPLEDSYPVDAQVIPDRPNEVVIAEYQRARVTIRTTAKNSETVWERQVGGNPIGVQALPGGKIFVVLQNRLIEVDRATNQEKQILNRPNHDIFRAKKTSSGDVVFVTNTGTLVRTGADGKVQKQFQVPGIPVLFGNIDILPNGNVLVPDFQQQAVVEYDTNGVQVHRFSTPWPSSAVRLPNGNTLVASQNSRRVVEVNRAGQEVWAFDVEGQVFNARRR